MHFSEWGPESQGALKYGDHSGAEGGGGAGRLSASSPSALSSLGAEISTPFVEEKSLKGYARRWLL